MTSMMCHGVRVTMWASPRSMAEGDKKAEFAYTHTGARMVTRPALDCVVLPPSVSSSSAVHVFTSLSAKSRGYVVRQGRSSVL